MKHRVNALVLSLLLSQSLSAQAGLVLSDISATGMTTTITGLSSISQCVSTDKQASEAFPIGDLGLSNASAVGTTTCSIQGGELLINVGSLFASAMQQGNKGTQAIAVVRTVDLGDVTVAGNSRVSVEFSASYEASLFADGIFSDFDHPSYQIADAGLGMFFSSPIGSTSSRDALSKSTQLLPSAEAGWQRTVLDFLEAIFPLNPGNEAEVLDLLGHR
jgi:hypothetical protein